MKKDIVIKNSHNDDMRTDIYIPSLPKENLPLIIFLHGFKGFKDWGGFPYLLEKISEKGFITVAFNFSLTVSTSGSSGILSPHFIL